MNYDQLTPLTNAPNTYNPSTACTMHTSFFILKVFFLWEFRKVPYALSQTVIKDHHWLWKGKNFCYAPARLNIQRSNKTRFPLNHIFIFSARVKLLIARPPHLVGSKSSRRVFLFNAHRKPTKPLAHELWINKFFGRIYSRCFFSQRPRKMFCRAIVDLSNVIVSRILNCLVSCGYAYSSSNYATDPDWEDSRRSFVSSD